MGEPSIEPTLFQDEFGVYTDKTTGQNHSVRRFTWTNQHKVSVQIITYGATVTSIKLPDKNGVIEDIVTGFDDMEGNSKHSRRGGWFHKELAPVFLAGTSSSFIAVIVPEEFK